MESMKNDSVYEKEVVSMLRETYSAEVSPYVPNVSYQSVYFHTLLHFRAALRAFLTSICSYTHVIPYFRFCSPLSFYKRLMTVYRPQGFDSANPVYKVKMWDESGKETEYMVDISKVITSLMTFSQFVLSNRFAAL